MKQQFPYYIIFSVSSPIISHQLVSSLHCYLILNQLNLGFIFFRTVLSVMKSDLKQRIQSCFPKYIIQQKLSPSLHHTPCLPATQSPTFLDLLLLLLLLTKNRFFLIKNTQESDYFYFISNSYPLFNLLDNLFPFTPL